VPELTPTDRVIALLEWGDVAEVDAEIESTSGWQGSLWRGTRALMEGRFGACERFAAEASEGDELASGVLVVALRREQERVAEAEIMLRLLLERFPSAPPSTHALLALLVAEMGRDTQARHELTRLLPRDPTATTGRLAVLYLLGELAATIDAAPEDIDVLYRRLLPHAGDFAVDEAGAACYGSVAFALGRLAQARSRWQEAAQFYDDALAAHGRIGAPLLLAHVQRHLAALLRMHGDEGDWDRAADLLSEAASIYGQLGVENRAAEAQAVLARAGVAAPPGGETVFRRGKDGWEIGPPDRTVRLGDARGLHDIARLLAAPLRPVHVTDLLGGAQAPPAGPAGDSARREYEARLSELAGELLEAERTSDPVRAALVRAERDSLEAVLDGAAGDPADQARLAVGTRIHISLDRIERAAPPVGRHLRTAIRTGTFCSYEPDEPVLWRL
jgi:tetratricopeptide (TPR) repeat protein